jgi:hypothetical protein
MTTEVPEIRQLLKPPKYFRKSIFQFNLTGVLGVHERGGGEGAEGQVASLWADGAHGWAIGGLVGQVVRPGERWRTVSLNLFFESIISFEPCVLWLCRWKACSVFPSLLRPDPLATCEPRSERSIQPGRGLHVQGDEEHTWD